MRLQSIAAQRILLPHLAFPLAASYVVMYRLQEASETIPIASNKIVINFMRAKVGL